MITFTFNRVSQALYIRHGIFPRMPIYFFNGAGDDMLRRLPDAPLRCVPVDNSAPCLAALARIDRHALGVSREKHHKFLLGDPVMQGALLYDGDNCVGYAYLSSGGQIGPLAVTEQVAAGPAFLTALRAACERGASQVSAFLPGACEQALSVAVAHGIANHLANAVDVIAGIWPMGAISAAQSGLHVRACQ